MMQRARSNRLTRAARIEVLLGALEDELLAHLDETYGTERDLAVRHLERVREMMPLGIEPRDKPLCSNPRHRPEVCCDYGVRE